MKSYSVSYTFSSSIWIKIGAIIFNISSSSIYYIAIEFEEIIPSLSLSNALNKAKILFFLDFSTIY